MKVWWPSLGVPLLAAGALFVGIVAFGPNEPVYQRKRLTGWLEEYNQAGGWEKTAPISEAIRAMGTNVLPCLVTFVQQGDAQPQWRMNAFRCAERLGLARWVPPPPTRKPLFAPSLLALKALGPTAQSAISEFAKMFEDPATMRPGGLALFSIGAASVPAFERACENTNRAVRALAASFLARLPISYNGDQPYYCVWNRFRPNSRLEAYVAIPQGGFEGLITILRTHQRAAVRRACTESLLADEGLCTHSWAGRSPNTVPLPGSSDQLRMAVRALQKGLKDADPGVRQACAETLRTLDPEATAETGINDER